MVAFAGVGLILSSVLGFLLLAFIGEVYYLLWWRKKKRLAIHSNTIIPSPETEAEHNYSHYAKDLLQLICWKNLKPAESTQNSDSRIGLEEEEDPELGNSKDLLIKSSIGEESVEAELMRIHNLGGPPRFLFTIKEETKEDLDSDDGRSTRKGSRTRSLSDLIIALDQNTTQFLAPLASPSIKCPVTSLESYSNPLFETTAASPPPKFKFLRDAEEKLYRRLREESVAARLKDMGDRSDGSSLLKEIQIHTRPLSTVSPTCSQVLPLESSRTTAFRPPLTDKNSGVC